MTPTNTSTQSALILSANITQLHPSDYALLAAEYGDEDNLLVPLTRLKKCQGWDKLLAQVFGDDNNKQKEQHEHKSNS
jgi:hypothetical protein